MSEDLSAALDNLLTSTDIQSHRYGIPSLEGIAFTDQTRVYEQELQYKKLYDRLIENLTSVIYFHELKALTKETWGTIEQEYDQIMPYIPMETKDPHQIARYLQQENSIKSKALLDNYLQVTLLVLKSIHHVDADSTTSENSISESLGLLFAKLNENLDSNVNKLLQQYEKTTSSMTRENDLRASLHKTHTELMPKLEHYNQLNQSLAEIKLKHTETINNGLKDVSVNEKTFRNKFNHLATQLNTIAVLLSVLPNFIMCLPLNWYDDKMCLNIIQSCGDNSDRFEKYRSVNHQALQNMNIDDLLVLGLQFYSLDHHD